ncbi:hypothetical protein [Streptomyces sp. SID5910]|uniref:hypothetical protein n=1 Tax=Streptomyces sp. SID5910 TaxID=2690312 RepID=UPI00136A9758|nr:hypothetical protein [Streptomyces sp. SID5910]MYR46620.1 hypothetical protein [Streptomyces sp. SID5910]
MTPMEGAAVVAGVTASGLPFALAACHAARRALDHRTPEWRAARRAAQDDRDLLRLARNTARKERSAVKPDHIAATAIDERSPDWCHTHGCPLSQCNPRGH